MRYLRNKNFYSEIVLSKKNGSLTPSAAKSIYEMCDYYCKVSLVNNRSFCVSSALSFAFKNWDKIDLKVCEGRENPGNAVYFYYGQVIKQGILRGAKKYNKVVIQRNNKIKKILNQFTTL